MAIWKLRRQTYGDEEYTLKEGEQVTVGRNEDNKIILTSIVISRNHCIIKVGRDNILITDLKSSNGVYVGTKKIPPGTPYCVNDSEVIGFGWIAGARLVDIKNNEKFVFKLSKERTSLIQRIQFQELSDLEDIESEIAKLDAKPCVKTSISPVQTKLKLKRKSNDNLFSIKQEDTSHCKSKVELVDLVSDSDNEVSTKKTLCKKIKLETINENIKKDVEIKQDKDELQFEAFNVKQEYLGYEDEAIQIDSDSDSESEQWIMRLSQSSPGKPFIKVGRESKLEVKPEESSYSQIDDGLEIDLYANDEEEEEFVDDIIKIPHVPTTHDVIQMEEDKVEDEDFIDTDPPLIQVPLVNEGAELSRNIVGNEDEGIDIVDGGFNANTSTRIRNNSSSLSDAVLETLINENIKQTSLIEPQPKNLKQTSSHSSVQSDKKSSSHKRKSKSRTSVSKKHISNSQKEERKKKLKDIATKDKDDSNYIPSTSSDPSQNKKPIVHVKVTSSNRGAFLTDVGIVKPTKRNESLTKAKKSKENKVKSKSAQDTVKKEKKQKDSEILSTSNDTSRNSQDNRVPLKSLKPLTGEDKSFMGRPCSKVEPLPPVSKPKKRVRFSEVPAEVHMFEIEPGNRMKKTSTVKTTQVDRLRQVPIFSLEKLTLMKILRWNPNWLEEQLNTSDAPPILGPDKPLTKFHLFKSHAQYVKLIGDLLLMEIWECLSQAYMKIRNSKTELSMRIESLPPPPTPERYFDLLTMSVNISMPTTETRNMPRMGDILLVSFGPESAKTLKFFFVHNVKNLPSPPYNKNSFYSVSLQSVYTDKMKFLKPGELLVGKVLAYVKKELMLFEAMEYLSRSPLCEAILRPTPEFFHDLNSDLPYNKNLLWTQELNSSQHRAVAGAVQSALGDRPTIHMVQGPPGTGKSSVICAIVMSYFYDAVGKLEKNRGKILICATSNAAVDDLVIRLLNIRQSLPKTERFRMVRVGRAEAMSARARDVSSLQLAARDVGRQRGTDAPALDLDHEMDHLQAKVNMWQTAAQDAKTPERVAYCQDKIHQLNNKIALLRVSGGGGGPRPEQISVAERRVIEKADIVATTLASAQNPKMRVLKGRIALCIVEEAGQAVEAETLVPLTLDVTNLTLIGDPQQLPGYICSQRAKEFGLGESLFYRLTSCAEQWPTGSPVVLLNEQYRMHSEIADYPNRAFYDGRIVTCVNRKEELPISPYMILGVSSGDKGQGSSGANELEAWAVCRLVSALYPFVKQLNFSLAVITPYNGHKDLIKKNLRNMQDPCESYVEVNTVDSFQGQERDVVIVSVARSCGAGFLADAGRINVLLTRAKRAMLLCVHPQALLRNPLWRTLIEDAQRRNLYRLLPNKMCQPITKHTPNDNILAQITPIRTNYHK